MTVVVETAAAVASVDVIVPLHNEERHLPLLIEQLGGQTESPNRIYLVVAPGEDRTRDICAAAARDDARFVVLDNPDRTAPHAMNRGLARSRADAWIRVDGHQEIPRDLVETLRRVCNETGAACVGPLTVTAARSATQQAIGLAMSSRWGVGNARFRTGSGGSGEVDAVAYGLYRRSVTERVGFFNTAMTRNQDDEYNTRLRRCGGRIWLTDQTAIAYFPRPSLRRLADQYRQYGHWRLVGTLVFGNQLRARQLVPPALVVAAVGAAVGGAGRPEVRVGLAAAYAGVLAAQVRDARRRGAGWRTSVTSAAAVACMHWSYGVGFWQGLPTSVLRRAALRATAARHPG